MASHLLLQRDSVDVLSVSFLFEFLAGVHFFIKFLKLNSIFEFFVVCVHCV